MKTFIANETLLLIEGEVYLLSNENYSIGDWCYDTSNEVISLFQDSLPKHHYRGYIKIIASTKQLPNVKQLPREVFVGAFDMEAMQQAYRHEQNIYLHDTVIQDFLLTAFEDGYNANKNEFTKDEMYQCALQFFYHWYNAKGSNTAQGLQEWLPTFINSLRPIALPQSITTNDELEIIKIEFQ